MLEIEKLIKKYNIDLNSLEAAKERYYEDGNSVGNPRFDLNRAHTAFDNLCSKFQEILNVAALEAGIKELYHFHFAEAKHYIAQVVFVGKVTEIWIGFSLFGSFNLIMDITNTRSIRHVNDLFLTQLSILSQLGDFTFIEGEKPTKSMRQKSPHLFRKTGDYYKLVRNYFLFEQEYPTYRIRLGSIKVSWASDTKFEMLIPKVCEAFKVMYQLNFMSWKYDHKEIKVKG